MGVLCWVRGSEVNSCIEKDEFSYIDSEQRSEKLIHIILNK